MIERERLSRADHEDTVREHEEEARLRDHSLEEKTEDVELVERLKRELQDVGTEEGVSEVRERVDETGLEAGHQFKQEEERHEAQRERMQETERELDGQTTAIEQNVERMDSARSELHEAETAGHVDEMKESAEHDRQLLGGYLEQIETARRDSESQAEQLRDRARSAGA